MSAAPSVSVRGARLAAPLVSRRHVDLCRTASAV
ncbi:MAG TPA: putative leader peptide [Pseudonocardia sp.]|nr:putative leader peptide [Pseudonocardia sp.]